MEKIPHKIQMAILARLKEQSPARYSFLKPDRVEGNVFVYHLRALISQGIVEKVPDGYGLTTEGKLYIDQLRGDGLGIRIQPRIVTLIALRRPDGAYLLYKRRQEPYRGLVGYPYGKIHLGERIAESAARECQDKIGISLPLIHAGDVYIGVRQAPSKHKVEPGELLMHTLFHVFKGTVTTEKVTTGDDLFWADPASISPEAQIPGFAEITGLLEQWRQAGKGPQRFFAEFWLDVGK
jgi:ADP-ribose pyrophosphatase YjhB (NUDIX family)